LREGFQANAIQFLGDVVVNLPGWAGLDARDLLQQLVRRIRLKRSPSGQQFVKNDTQTEDVTAAIDSMPLASGLFRTHVGGAPAPRAPPAGPGRIPPQTACRSCRAGCSPA